MSEQIPQSLHAMQRWMLDTITHPGGPRAGSAATAADKANPFAGRKPHALIARSRNLTSVQRIEIYANMYYWRLLDCMESDFPSVKHATGEAFFSDLAKDYLVAHPSRYYNLNRLGEHFASFLRGRKSLRNRVFLAELAELERAIEVVFDAPVSPVISKAALGRTRQDQWAAMRLEVIPAFSLHAFSYPVNIYLEGVRRETSPSLPAREKSWVAVYRKNDSVWRMDLSRQQYVILKKLRTGSTVAAALEAGLAVPGTDMEQIVGQIARWFELWAARGFFARLHTPAVRTSTE